MEFPPVPENVVSRLITRPEDLEENVNLGINQFRENALQGVEDFVAGYQQPHVLELDGNRPPNTVLNQLKLFLRCHPMCPSVIPMRFYRVRKERNTALDEEAQAEDDQEEEAEAAEEEAEEAEEEEEEEEGGLLAEDADVDEVMRTLGARKRPSPKFRWRRSKWLMSCPVKLKNGELFKGNPTHAVQFLDKIFVLSTMESANKFIANPRPYLLPPQPRPPCRFVITGMPLSGKSTLAELLARRYGSIVIDMKKIMSPKLEEERKKKEEEMMLQTVQAAVERVKSMRIEAIAQQRTASIVQKDSEAADGGATTEDGQQPEDSQATGETAEKKEAEEKPPPPGGLDTIGETEEENIEAAHEAEANDAEDGPIEVTVADDDPEVMALVDQVMAEFQKREITLPANAWVEHCKEAIKEAEKKNCEKLGFQASGGWILDGFPFNKDQWQEMGSNELFPDQVIYLKDGSDKYVTIVKRWFQLNRDKILNDIRKRILKEAETRRSALETERRRKYEEDVQRQEEMAAIAAANAQNAEGEATEEHVDTSGFEPVPEPEELPPLEASDAEFLAFEKFVTDSSVNPDLIVDYPEIEAFRKELTDVEVEWNGTISQQLRQLAPSSAPLAGDPVQINVETFTKVEEMMETVSKQLEAPFKYVGWEYGPIDVDEDELDNEGEGEEEEMEEEEEEEANPETKKTFGDAADFCPVHLKEKGILWPGNPDIAAKYRERVYFFASEENRERFLADPTKFISENEPPKIPPLRICLVGPKGSGKTMQGRQIAQKLDLFYVNFREKLEEIMLLKLGKRIGPEMKDSEEWDELIKKDGEIEKLVTELEKIPDPNAEEQNEEKEDGDQAREGGVESAAGSEKEEPQLNEVEQAIRDNLEMADPTTLPNNVMEEILPPFWNEEPFKSSGFIMEGFPRTDSELRWMADMGFFPDNIVFLNIEQDDVTGRLLPERMDAWTKRREKAKQQRKSVAEARKKQRLQMMAKRREELLAEKASQRAQEKAEREALKLAKNEDEDAEEEFEEEEEEEHMEEEDDYLMIDNEEVNQILMDEFPEEEMEEEDEDEETEEDAKERLEQEISEFCDSEKSAIEIIHELCVELRLPTVDIDAAKKPHIVRYNLNKKMRQFIDWRPSLFERVQIVRPDTAERLLSTGYKRLSRFGRWCPVKLLEGECFAPNWDPPAPLFPAIYRSHIYYLSSVETRKQFQHEPIKYIGPQVPDPPPVVPIRLALVGPPKSGKTTMAKRLQHQLGVVRLSAGEAMRWVLTNAADTTLAIMIDTELRKGKTVPNELVVASIEAAILGITGCRTRGYVLDGWPATREQAELLTKSKITPFRVVELFLSSEETMTRGLRDRTAEQRPMILHDSAQILAIKLAAHRQNMPLIKQWYESEHPASFDRVDGFASRWAVWEKSISSVKQSVRNVQNYLVKALVGKAAPIFGLCIRPNELKAKLSDFGHYCPVALANDELFDCVKDVRMTFSAEYRGFYYQCASKENLDKFLNDPDQFVPPLAPNKLPESHLLPKRLEDGTESQLPLALAGFCGVSFGDGKLRYESLVPGSKQFSAEYDKKLYRFAGEQQLESFMR